MTDESAHSSNAAGASSVAMMPWFLGGPWVPKFGDEEKNSAFNDWRTQIEIFLRAQSLTPAQQVDFVLSALQGEARREVLLLAPTDRDSPTKIFRVLEGLYGEQVTVVQLRARFFTCKQQAGEEVGGFILRLRECLARWRLKEPAAEGAGDDDEMLRSQLVAGLRPGPMQLELQKLLRRNPDLTFAAVRKEAQAVERELNRSTEEVDTRRTYVPPSAPDPAKSTEEWQELKKALKAEVLAEVKEQITTLKDSILGEIRQQFRENQHPPQPGSSGGRNQPRWNSDPPHRRRRD